MLAAALLIALLWGVLLLVERARLRERLAATERSRDDASTGEAESRRAMGALEASLAEAGERIAALRAQAADLSARLNEIESAHAERVRLLTERHDSAIARERAAASALEHALRAEFDERSRQFTSVIEATAATAMRQSGEQLLKLAGERFGMDHEKAKAELDSRKQAVESMVKPITDTLAETKRKIDEIEKERAATFAQVSEQIVGMRLAGDALRKETANLVQALRKPQVRGRYGEVQLRRVAELAGMRDYCDFSEQTSARDGDGKLLRPDLIVQLPNGRVIAVDAKTNIDAYIDAVESSTPERAEEHLERFARHVAEQSVALANKRYWSQLEGSPEFTVMFVPGDQFIDAALQRRPDLLETAAQHGVILASPSTLIGLLRAVAVGWREKKLSDSANELFKLGRELHARSANVLDAVARVGRSLGSAAGAYNELVGSLDSRLMPTLRKFEERDAKSSEKIADPAPVEMTIRQVRSLPALTDGAPE